MLQKSVSVTIARREPLRSPSLIAFAIRLCNDLTFSYILSQGMKFQATTKVLRAHRFEGFICFLKLKILLQISCNRAPDKIQPCFHMRANLEPLSTKLHDSLRFLYPPLPSWYCASVTRCLPRAGNHTGLPRSVLITGWVRCCLLRRRVNVHVWYSPKFISCPFTFWSKRINNFRFFVLTTLTTVHIYSPYHPSRHLPRCCYRRGNLVPTASYPGSLHTHVSVGSTDGTEGQLVLSKLIR